MFPDRRALHGGIRPNIFGYDVCNYRRTIYNYFTVFPSFVHFETHNRNSIYVWGSCRSSQLMDKHKMCKFTNTLWIARMAIVINKWFFNECMVSLLRRHFHHISISLVYFYRPTCYMRRMIHLSHFVNLIDFIYCRQSRHKFIYSIQC